MKKILLAGCLLLLMVNSALAHPNETLNLNADYATGFAVGEGIGTGLFIRKYFERNYVQIVGAYSYGDEPVSNLGIAVGRYFYQEKITGIELPIGLHYFFTTRMQYWHDDIDAVNESREEINYQLASGIGLAIDFLNPGTRGVGSSFSIGYGTRMQLVGDSNELENVYLGAVFASASLVYNW